MVVTIIDILWKKQNTRDSECRNCSLEMGEGVLGIKESNKRCDPLSYYETFMEELR